MHYKIINCDETICIQNSLSIVRLLKDSSLAALTEKAFEFFFYGKSWDSWKDVSSTKLFLSYKVTS